MMTRPPPAKHWTAVARSARRVRPSGSEPTRRRRWKAWNQRIVDLANPPAVIPPGEIVFKTPTGKYICSVCGYVYDPAEHDGVAFEDLPADWRCPRCKQPKEKFNRA